MKKYILIAALGLALLAGCSPGSRPEIVSYTVDENAIKPGGTVWLSWMVEGADDVYIDNGVGRVRARGILQVMPDKITAYNLTATNSSGTIVSALIVNVVAPPPAVPVVTVASTTTTTSSSDHTHASQESGDGHVWFKGAVMVGADEHWITLHNNTQAHDPSWSELVAFLRKDNTDKQAYVPGKFTCGDFAEMLHNNAEAAGLRTAIIAVVLAPANPSEGILKHSLNAFETTDRGTVFIDATSSQQGLYADKTGEVAVGRHYIPTSIESGRAWSDMGVVMSIDIFQW
jgi:hypothetical protein